MNPLSSTFADLLARGDERLDAQEWAAALGAFREAARAQPSPKDVWKLDKRFRKLAELPPQGRGTPLKVALLSDATQDYLRVHLNVALQALGLDATFYVAPYGQVVQEVLAPDSGLAAFGADLVWCQTRGESLFPHLYGLPAGADPDATLDGYLQHVRTLAEKTSGIVLVDDFIVPPRPRDGVPARWNDEGATVTLERINARLAEFVAQLDNGFVFDLDAFASRVGKDRIRNRKLWHLGKIPVDEPFLSDLASECLRFIKPMLGLNRKCLVLDLDNTLWGGVVGEVGADGVQLGPDGDGAPFLEFQQQILTLFERGIILGVASKNNPADALEVIEKHPSMVLRPEHFASVRINWNDKVQSLREIASEINIGVDSLVFLDDNPVERENVRARLPEVLTPELPPDSMDYAPFLESLTDFDPLRVTAEDKARGKMYAAEKQRRTVQESADDLEGYLRTLETVLDVHRARPGELARVQQLMQKTNQFNTTTLRWTQGDVTEFLEDEGRRIHTAHVRDRFGDNGLCGLCVSRRVDGQVEILDLLLSCRVLGRGVEDAFLRTVLAQWREDGARAARAEIRFTAKNIPVREVFGKNGFHQAGGDADGTVWESELAADGLSLPDWIRVEGEESVEEGT